MHFVYNALFVAAAVKWGDWKRWRDYYSTMLFFIIGDLLKNFLFYDYHIWTYKETIFAEHILVNHTFISLMIMAVVYPCTIAIYLGRFPENRWKQIFWVLLWVILYIAVEFINVNHFDLLDHHNGWNMWWSLLFNIVMFTMLFIHYKNPLIAWLISVAWIVFLMMAFDVPIEHMK